ncbi:MAG: hypothetical protein JW774_05190 [Candidatus Aureabacteria bacterium]|nr:hypothetical protein [Candidatus Auribacterota bacterium]
MSDLLATKQRQFNEAMERYEKIPGYKLIGRFVSFTNVSLQIFLAILVVPQSIGLLSQVLTFGLAYVLTDFVNGLVHMYMDNNDDYDSYAGPLIASFHLHHRTPRYKENPLHIVYYNESGSKLWLVFFLAVSVVAVAKGIVTGAAAYGLLYFSVLSSVAEVSHYFCHTPQNKLVKFLGNLRILLNIRYHAQHHLKDNYSYAFLNGLSDPLINRIARKFYAGYKNTTDLHYARYEGPGTENR